MGKVVHAAERFIYGHAPHLHEQNSAWYCIDDRYALVKGLYRQIAGGAAGVGQDIAVSHSMRVMRRSRHNQVVDLAQRRGFAAAPAQVLGSIAAKTLSHQGVKLGLHQGCAAEDGAAAIVGIQADKRASVKDELWRRSRVIKPDLTSEQFMQNHDINAWLLRANRILDAEEAKQQFSEGGQWEQEGSGLWTLDPVERVSLVDSKHVAADLLADYGRNVALDARAAFEAGTPAYHVSLGDMPAEIAGPLSDVIPFEVGDFMAVTAIRHAATSIALDAHVPRSPELPADQTPRLALHRIAA